MTNLKDCVPSVHFPLRSHTWPAGVHCLCLGVLPVKIQTSDNCISRQIHYPLHDIITTRIIANMLISGKYTLRQTWDMCAQGPPQKIIYLGKKKKNYKVCNYYWMLVFYSVWESNAKNVTQCVNNVESYGIDWQAKALICNNQLSS